jgi:hypothetical protein
MLKTHSSNFRFFTCSILRYMNKIISSAYCKIERHSSTKWGTKPVICLSSLALEINKVSMSATKLKSKDFFRLKDFFKEKWRNF